MPRLALRKSGVKLSTPWGGSNSSLASCRGPADKSFVQERSRVHEVFIREQATTKRLALVLAAILIIVSGGVVLFAPEGREKMSYWVGAALLLFAGGAAGYGRLWARHKFMSLQAGGRDD